MGIKAESACTPKQMPNLLLGEIHAKRYKQCSLNVAALRAHVLCAGPEQSLNVSMQEDRVILHVPDVELRTVPAFCGAEQAPLGLLSRAPWQQMLESVRGTYNSGRVVLVLVYTCDNNVFVMLSPLLCVGREYVVLPPWHGWCREEGEQRMLSDSLVVQSKTPLCEVEDRVRAAAMRQQVAVDEALGPCTHYKHSLTLFEQIHYEQSKCADDCAEAFCADIEHTGMLTYTSVIPGLLMSVGRANELISQALPSSALGAVVIKHMRAFLPDTQQSTDRDVLWFFFFAQLVLKLAHKCVRNESYRGELGEDIRPVFSPGVFGTKGDCEDHMGCFLSIVRGICENKEMLQGTCFEAVSIGPGLATQLFAGRGLMRNGPHTPDKRFEFHAFTVAMLTKPCGVCLHIVENTSPVFVYHSEEQRAAVAEAFAQQGPDIMQHDQNFVQYVSEAKMQSLYTVQWLDACMLFEVNADGQGGVTMSLTARPYTMYVRVIEVRRRKEDLFKELEIARETSVPMVALLLLNPAIFFSEYNLLGPYTRESLPECKFAPALGTYLFSQQAFDPLFESIFAQGAECLDAAAENMDAVLTECMSHHKPFATDLRMMHKPQLATPEQTLQTVVPRPMNPAGMSGAPPLINTVRNTLYTFHRLLQELKYSIHLYHATNGQTCMCLVQRFNILCTCIQGLRGYYADIMLPWSLVFGKLCPQNAAPNPSLYEILQSTDILIQVTSVLLYSR